MKKTLELYERSLMNPSQENNSSYPFMRKFYLDELFDVESAFDDRNFNRACPQFEKEIQPIEQVSYQAFGKELNYAAYSFSIDDLEIDSHCTVVSQREEL